MEQHQDNHQAVVIAGQNPFAKNGLGSAVNQGAVAIEQERAIAEAQGQIIVAKRFPRSNVSVMAEFLEACKSAEFAATAFYAVPNRGTGPSIRFAEELARCMGNFQYGHRELGRADGKSEVEVFAWDVEKNNRSIRQITVAHIQDTKNGPKKLTDQSDIDNKIANIASKQMRGRIMALLPKHIVAAGIAACKKTLAGENSEPMAKRMERMTTAFARFGVTAAHLESYLNHKLDTTTDDEIADLTGVFNAIKDGTNKASEFFNQAEKEPAAAGEAIKALAATESTKPKVDAAPAAVATTAAKSQVAKKTTSENRADNSQKVAESPKSEAPPPETRQQSAAEIDSPASNAGQPDIF